ncbi:MAG: hypothetical protein ACQEP7_05300, partial [bacterium]
MKREGQAMIQRLKTLKLSTSEGIYKVKMLNFLEKFRGYIFLLFFISFLFLTVAGQAAQITTCSELEGMSLDGDHTLENDIDCSSLSNFTPVGTSGSPFTGTFNGQGYTISSLDIDDVVDAGLFGVIGTTGEVKNFTIDGVEMIRDSSNNDNVGGLVGTNNGTIDTVTVIIPSGNVIEGGDYAGGFVGIHDGIIRDSLVELNGEVRNALTTVHVGGFVADIKAGTIARSGVKGSGQVTMDEDDYNVGGFAAQAEDSNLGDNDISNVFSTVKVNASSAGANAEVGGLIGSVGTSRTMGPAFVAGEVAVSSAVNPEDSGAIFGNITYSNPSGDDMYWDYQATGFLTDSADNSDSFTTNEMTYDYDVYDPPNSTDGPYYGWDFDGTWAHDSDSDINSGYPVFTYQTVTEPSISIVSPEDGYDTSAETIDVTGEAQNATQGDSVVVEDNSGDTQVEELDSNLNWTASGVSLSLGENTITAKLMDTGPGSTVVDSATITVNRLEPVEFASSRLMADTLVIGSAADEGTYDRWVVIYNPTEQDVDLSDYWFARYSSAADWDAPSDVAQFSAMTDNESTDRIIPAGGYFSLARDVTNTTFADVEWDVVLLGSDASLGLYPFNPENFTATEAKDGRLDAVGFGTVDHVFETNTAGSLSSA